MSKYPDTTKLALAFLCFLRDRHQVKALAPRDEDAIPIEELISRAREHDPIEVKQPVMYVWEEPA
jgi:hypothetical protein